MGRTACTESQCLYRGALYFLLYMYLHMNIIKYVKIREKCYLNYTLHTT